jgi:hypothetical protein
MSCNNFNYIGTNETKNHKNYTYYLDGSFAVNLVQRKWNRKVKSEKNKSHQTKAQ